MTIFNRARGKRRIRIDVGQLADELAKRAPDLENFDLSSARELAVGAVHDASERARHSFERARGMSSDAGQPERSFEELGQRLRDLAGTSGVRSFLARLERDLPDTDKDRYDRAYARGRVHARTIYLALGLAAGVGAGIAVAILLEPRHGPERRQALARRARTITGRVQNQVGEATSRIRERAASESEPVAVMDVPETPLPEASGPIPEAGQDPETEPHEALPDPQAPAGEPPAEGDPTDPTVHA